MVYWISNKEVQNFIKEHPDDYDDMVDIEVENISQNPLIRIIFQDHPDDIEHISRYCYLSTFRESAKARWMEFSGKLREYQLNELKKALEYYERKVQQTKEEIAQYEND